MIEPDHIRIALVAASYSQKPMAHVLDAISTFINDLQKLKIVQRNLFVDENIAVLQAIKFELEYAIADPKNAEYKQRLITCRDRLFGSLLRNVHVVNDRQHVTRKFNEFIKGITRFNDYEHGDDVRKRYTERLIYEKIWFRIMKSQHDLKDTQKCDSIQVDVEFTQDNVPVKMILNEDDITEIYTKRFDPSTNTYLPFVDCIRYEPDQHAKMKHNTFEKEGVFYSG